MNLVRVPLKNEPMFEAILSFSIFFKFDFMLQIHRFSFS